MANKSKQTITTRSLKTARPVPTQSTSAGIKESFRDDTAARVAVAEGLAERVRVSTKFAEQAAKRFDRANFAPSLFTKREREPRRYLEKDQNLAAAQTTLVKDGIARIRKQPNAGSLKIELTENVAGLVKGGGKANARNQVPLKRLLNCSMSCSRDRSRCVMSRP